MHKHYEELCALAATGQISGESMSVLDSHVKKCDECRTFLEDVIPLGARVAPLAAAGHTQAYAPPEGMRERFLQRAAEAGIPLHGNPMLAQVAESLAATSLQHERRREWKLRWPQLSMRVAVPFAAAIVCGFLGYWIALHNREARPAVPELTQGAVPLVAPANHGQELAKLQNQRDSANSRVEKLALDLSAAQQENEALRQKLTALSQSAEKNQQLEQQLKTIAQQLQTSEATVHSLNGDLAAARKQASTQDAVLMAQQAAVQEANAKAASLQAQSARSQAELEELSSGKNQGDELIAARNLHIVDVYDSESDGGRKHAFGRVFYVEGKSLVFYAYDLPTDNKDHKIQFKVWGERAGVKTVSLSLGAMQNDTTGQGRWLLVCNDPKVLSRINAVYLTREVGDARSSQPRGQKMMYAFLGSPNHP